MSVNSTHPDYDASLPAWRRARDVMAREGAVKSAGERSFLRLEAQADEAYAAYRARGAFFNATARAADGYLGLIFRRPPVLNVQGVGTTNHTKDTNKRATGALRRARGVGSADCLLQLILKHTAIGLSLRQTVVRARELFIADISDVALLKRLRASEPWLRALTARMTDLDQMGVV